ncbi:MAG: permease [Pseudomonadota bacterium]
MSSCCPTKDTHNHNHSRFDYIMNGSLAVILIIMMGYILAPEYSWIHDMAYAIIELFHTMWWGLLLGILFIGLMSKVPREYYAAIMGRDDNILGIMRAIIAGIVLDLCNHGILLVAAKLYERGVSMPKVMAFMIASPWNSLSLTFILFAFIGVKWTLIYTALSMLIALTTGLIYAGLTTAGIIPQNKNKIDLPKNFSVTKDAKKRLKTFKADKGFFYDITFGSWNEVKMLLRWLLLGLIITAAIRAFVPPEMFASTFGPTFLGLAATLGVTTILEICSEGSAPIAAEIFTSAKAPGNAFAFLMAGVATDYTEIMIIREFAKSWWIALSLPLITVPQILLLGWILNMAGTP